MSVIEKVVAAGAVLSTLFACKAASANPAPRPQTMSEEDFETSVRGDQKYKTEHAAVASGRDDTSAAQDSNTLKWYASSEQKLGTFYYNADLSGNGQNTGVECRLQSSTPSLFISGTWRDAQEIRFGAVPGSAKTLASYTADATNDLCVLSEQLSRTLDGRPATDAAAFVADCAKNTGTIGAPVDSVNVATSVRLTWELPLFKGSFSIKFAGTWETGYVAAITAQTTLAPNPVTANGFMLCTRRDRTASINTGFTMEFEMRLPFLTIGSRISKSLGVYTNKKYANARCTALRQNT